jgi:hypothetical protein
MKAFSLALSLVAILAASSVAVPPWDTGCGPEDQQAREYVRQQAEEIRWQAMSPGERIAEELRLARIDRERAARQAHEQREYDRGNRPGTWLYWFRYGGQR